VRAEDLHQATLRVGILRNQIAYTPMNQRVRILWNQIAYTPMDLPPATLRERIAMGRITYRD
jgi:hypothetical protein